MMASVHSGSHEAAGRLPAALRVIGATRPWSFSMTIISVALGSLCAGARGPIHWWLALLALAGALCLHAATNLANDYYDHRDGIDTPDAPGVRARHHPLVEGTLLPRQVMAGAAGFWLAAALIGSGLGASRGWPLAALTGIGILAGFFYSAGPVRLKARALGELTAFLLWGPGMMLGSFFVQRMSFRGSGQALVLSVIQGLWVAEVLLSNNLRDRKVDAGLGIVTPATLLTEAQGKALAVALCAASYLFTALAVLLGSLRPWALLVFSSVPLTARLLRSFYGPRGVPGRAPADAARTAMVFGLLLVLSQALPLAAGV